MNKESKIEGLARHLQIQNELLIVQVGSSSDFLVFNPKTNELKKTSVPKRKVAEWLMSLGSPFTLVKQRGKDDEFVIPDVEKWEKDEELDY